MQRLGWTAVFTLTMALTTLAGCPAADDGGPEPSAGPGVSPGPGAEPGVTPNPDAPPGAEAPSVDSVTAVSVGRTGYHLDVTIEGSDVNGDVVTAFIRFLDAGGDELDLFDGNADGTPDNGFVETSFDESVTGEASFSRTLSFRNYLRSHPDIAQVAVQLQDQEALVANEVTVDIDFQEVRAMGESCDATFVVDRCEIGLACTGTPTTCQEGTAPEITELAFLEDSATGGSRILVDGIENEGDMATLVVEFLDADDNSVMLDLDVDGTAESDFFVVDAQGSDYGEGDRFFVGLEQPPEFADMVAKVAVTPSDLAEHEGERVVAQLRRTPTRGNGQSCDPRGFNVCGTGTTCTPGIVGETNLCRSVTSSQQQMCTSALVLDPSAGVSVVVGEARGASLWDPPTECAANDPKGLPDAVVRLHLEEDAPFVRLSTAEAGTDFDTILYMLPECARTADAAMVCGDDTNEGIFAEVEMSNLAAGDYYVVIDSYDRSGGAFTLSVAFE